MKNIHLEMSLIGLPTSNLIALDHGDLSGLTDVEGLGKADQEEGQRTLIHPPTTIINGRTLLLQALKMTSSLEM
jgi:hypothetical protein